MLQLETEVKQQIAVSVCNDSKRWDDFVTSMPASSNYHRWGWRLAIENTFGHQAYYLTASEGETIQGVLPLFRMKSRLFGHFLVSIPFFSYGGVIAATTEARDALLAKAEELAKELGVSHVELRQTSAIPTDWKESTAKVTMEVALPGTVDELWNGLSSGMRNKVRSGRKSNFRIEWQGIEGVEHFYRVFSLNMRNLGTPVYPKSWFENLCKQFPSDVRLLNLFDGDEAVASGLMTCYGKTLELPWSATLLNSRRKYSAVLMYWTILEWAVQNGYKSVDFGRCTRGSGVYEFKRHWGCQERELHWYYSLKPGQPVPALRPENPRYRLATELWKKLPLSIANILGPRIVKSIP